MVQSIPRKYRVLLQTEMHCSPTLYEEMILTSRIVPHFVVSCTTMIGYDVVNETNKQKKDCGRSTRLAHCSIGYRHALKLMGLGALLGSLPKH